MSDHDEVADKKEVPEADKDLDDEERAFQHAQEDRDQEQDFAENEVGPELVDDDEH